MWALRHLRALLLLTLLIVQTGRTVAADDMRIETPFNLDLPAPLQNELHSLLIYKDGALVFEKYYTGNDDHIDFKGGVKRVASEAPVQWHRARKHYVASVTKAITALIAGAAMEELGLHHDAKLLNLAPPALKTLLSDKTAGLTLHHLLSMQTGFVWDEWQADDLVQLWQQQDFSAHLLRKKNNGPGTAWRYNSAAPNLLLTILEYQLGEPMHRWADKNFFQKLGIVDYHWASQPTGTPEGAARLHLRPRDMLKIGISVLQDGRWKDQQVIPSAWVKAATSMQATSSAGDYGYFFWLRNLGGVNYISADGDGGQYINVFPQHRTVVVMTGGHYLDWPRYAHQANTIMQRHIFPALGITPSQR